MSSTSADPAHAQARAQAQSRARASAILAVCVPVAAALWALVALTLVPVLDTFRLIALDGTHASSEASGRLPENGITLLVVAILFAALFESVVGWFSTRAFSTFSSEPLLRGGVAFGGATAGFAIAWALGWWAEPQAVGVTTGDQEAALEWGAFRWIGYHAIWIIPLALGIVAAVMIIRLIRTHSRDQWRATKIQEMKQHGVSLPGTIIQVIPVSPELQESMEYSVTITFVGKFGPGQTSRFVTVPVSNAPVTGGQVTVWYDPLGDEEQVHFEFTKQSSDASQNRGLFS